MRIKDRILALLLAALLACACLPAALTEDNGLEIVYDDAPAEDAAFDAETEADDGISEDVDAPVGEADDFGDTGLTLDDGAEDEPEAPTIRIEGPEPEEQAICPDVPLDSDEAAAAYIRQAFDGQPTRGAVRMRAAYATTASQHLEGVDLRLYNALKPQIQAVAAGQRSSTIFYVPINTLFDQEYYTATELGLESFYDEEGQLTNEAFTAIDRWVGIDIGNVIYALMADCPYELYWYDKTVGIRWVGVGYELEGERLRLRNYAKGRMYCKFAVAKAYSKSGELGTNETDSTRLASVKTAAANAHQIVERCADLGDLEKLTSYKNAICDLVSYNHDALAKGTPYGDPWQLVYVFDGDSTTNVVCEGYSKAFQYLCDESQFNDGRVSTVVCATGMMTTSTGGGGFHMWNLVNIDEVNYLADITNCDANHVGYPDKLFMKGYAYTDDVGNYCFNVGSKTITYSFDSRIINLFKDENLQITDDAVGLVNDDVSSGTLGALRWSMNSLGVLYISGSGSIPDFSEENPAPWAGSQVKRVSLASGVTGIGACAFLGCENLEQVTIPNTVTFIDETAFEGCPNMIGQNHKGLIIYSCANTDICDWADGHIINHSVYHGVTITDWPVEPTCTETGLTQGSHCEVCNLAFVAQEVIPAKGHKPVTVKGRAATCTDTGLTDGEKCSVCGEWLVEQEVIPALEHDWGAPTYTWSSDNRKVTATRVCGRDDSHKETETVNTTPAVALAATCTTRGKTTYTATFTNPAFETQTRTVEDIPETGHSWGAPTYVWADDGRSVTARRVCGRDASHKETETVNTTSAVALAPTCTAKGKTIYTAIFTNRAFAKQTRTVENIPANGHKPVAVGYAATCAKAGLTDGVKCSVCDAWITPSETIPATGKHSFGAWKTTKAPTCTATGTQSRSCSVCNKVETQTLAKLAHKPTTVKGYAATYAKAGLTDGVKCSVCGTWITPQTAIPRKTYPGSVLSRKGKNGTITVNVGEAFYLTPQFATNAKTKVKRYKSSKKGVATVDKTSGLVVPKKEGKATITVTTKKKKVKATVTIKVVDPYKPKGVSITSGKTVTLKVGQTLKLGAALQPTNARTTLTWKSSKKKVASVNKTTGEVTAKKKGKTKITVTTKNNKKATITVKVVP